MPTGKVILQLIPGRGLQPSQAIILIAGLQVLAPRLQTSPAPAIVLRHQRRPAAVVHRHQQSQAVAAIVLRLQRSQAAAVTALRLQPVRAAVTALRLQPVRAAAIVHRRRQARAVTDRQLRLVQAVAAATVLHRPLQDPHIAAVLLQAGLQADHHHHHHHQDLPGQAGAGDSYLVRLKYKHNLSVTSLG